MKNRVWSSRAPEIPRVPDFLLAGAGRSGTTYLHALLRSNPHVYMPWIKEPRFFTDNYDLGADWYTSLFARAAEGQVAGEASAGYLASPEAPERIFELAPEVRLVFLLRHPVERAWSHYTREIQTRGQRRPFMEAPRHDDYIAAGLYAQHLGRYLDHFPRERMLVLRSEELFDRTLETLRTTERFLGLGAHDGPPDGVRRQNESRMPHSLALQRFLHERLRPSVAHAQRNYGRSKFGPVVLHYGVAALWKGLDVANHAMSRRATPRIDPHVRRRLEGRYRSEIEDLEELLGWDLSDWKRAD